MILFDSTEPIREYNNYSQSEQFILKILMMIKKKKYSNQLRIRGTSKHNRHTDTDQTDDKSKTSSERDNS